MRIFTITLESLRYYTYWFKDFLFGSKIRNHLKEITYVLSNYSSSKSKQIREHNLSKILMHAAHTTSFYKKYNHKSLQNFPVINKNIVRDNIEDFKSSAYKKTKNKTIKTSGSTGAFLKLEHNRNKVLRNTADTLYFSRKVNFKVGYRIYYMRHWLDYYKKHPLINFLQNIKAIESLSLINKKLDTLIRHLKKDPSNIVWLGYASSFEQVCKYLTKQDAKPINVSNLKSIITISEGLNDYTRTKLEYYFNVPVVSRYSNMENGIIAQQVNGSKLTFQINWASYYVEILDLKYDKPAKPGALGRIVVTDLFNFCTPLIRYDTGDIGSIDLSVSPPALDRIEGRKADIILNTNGEIVSSFITINIYDFEGIKQTQLIQEQKKTYRLKLNVFKTFNQETDLKNRFKSFLGDDAKIIIEYVDEIPLLASGKRKPTINNFLNRN